MAIKLSRKTFERLAKRLEGTWTIEDVPKINGVLAPVLGILREVTSSPAIFEATCTSDTFEVFRDAVTYAPRYRAEEHPLIEEAQVFPQTVAALQRLEKLERNDGDIHDLHMSRRFVRKLRWGLYSAEK